MTTNNLRMLVVRPVRDSALSHYVCYQSLKVDYVVLSDTPYKPFVRNLNKGVLIDNLCYRTPFLYKFINKLIPFDNLKWKLTQKEIEEKVKCADIINIPDTYYFYSAQIASLAKKYNKFLITTIWMTIPNHITTWFPPYSFNTNTVVKNTDLFILRNESALKFTDSLGIKKEKIKVIYKGVNLNHFKPMKKKEGGKVKILFVGGLYKAKGILKLARVFKKLVDNSSATELLVAGKGPLEKKLKKILKGYPVHFYGFVDYRRLAKLYGESDIFCAPSGEQRYFGLKTWEEYFSYVLMEAQAAGLPIVTTNSGGIPEEVDGRNYLVKPEDENSLYEALRDLIENREKREVLGKINRERAQKFYDTEKQARLTEEAIMSAYTRSLKAKIDKHQ